MASSDAKAAKRARLTRERILSTALEFADANGVESLKMRELGQALGFEAMALYRHVANKEEIVDGILDLVLDEIEPPSPSADWADAIRASAISIHEALGRHGWATRLLASSAGLRPARLNFMEALLDRLDAAGFSDDLIYHAYHVLDAYIFGFSLWLAGKSLTEEEQLAVLEKVTRDISFADYPQLARHRDQHLAEGPHQDVSAFEIGLDLILQGLKDMHAKSREPESPRDLTSRS